MLFSDTLGRGGAVELGLLFGGFWDFSCWLLRGFGFMGCVPFSGCAKDRDVALARFIGNADPGIFGFNFFEMQSPRKLNTICMMHFPCLDLVFILVGRR